jgi:hypothetical protein
MTPNEQRLLRLCRRLLRHNEQLQEDHDGLHSGIRKLIRENRELTDRLRRLKQDHAVKDSAAEAILGEAFRLLEVEQL